MPGAFPSDQASRQMLKITAMGLLPGQRQSRSFTMCSFSTVDEPFHFIEELGEGRLVLQQDVIAAIQGHKPCAANARYKLPSGLERDDGILRGVKDERRRCHALEQVCHIDRCGNLLPGRRVVRRNGPAMKLA